MLVNWKMGLVTLAGLALMTSFVPIDPSKETSPFGSQSQKWADSVMQTLSAKEQIAQLFIVSASSLQDSADAERTERILKKHSVGGIVYPSMWEGAAIEVETSIPLLHVARMGEMISHKNTSPGIYGIAAVTNDKLLDETGKILARGLQDRNFQMVVVNSFPQDQKEGGLLSKKAANLLNGMQKGNVLVGLVDSSQNSLEVSPGLESQLTAYAPGPADLQDSLPSNVSSAFSGLKILDLDAVLNTAMPDEELIVKAFSQDYDVALGVTDFEAALDAVTLAIKKGAIDENVLKNKVRKVLTAKAWANKEADSTFEEIFPINNLEQVYLKKVRENALTLVKNKNAVLPLKELDTLALISVFIGHNLDSDFIGTLNLYQEMSHYQALYKNLEGDFANIKDGIANKDYIILYAGELGKETRDLSQAHLRSVLERIAYQGKVLLVWGGDPKDALPYLYNPNIHAVLFNYSDHPESKRLAAQAIFGGVAIQGNLPQGLDSNHLAGYGIVRPKTRLGYGYPEEVGIDRTDLAKVDAIVGEALTAKATPGAQVFFARDGIVVYNKGYGFHTYEEKNQVKTSDLYDLASITKIAATTGALMRLATEDRFSLDNNLCDYLMEEIDTACYLEMNIRAMLAHQAGLPPFVPFFSKTLVKGVPRYDVYSLAPSDMYPFRVAENLYIRKDYRDEMFNQLLRTPLRKPGEYVYSDLAYYFMQRIIEKQSGKSLDEYVDSVFYAPMGMSTMTYLPRRKFPLGRLAPTEYDLYFRDQLIHGDVHDPGAAMMGGVAGHAGLFSNANDLGKYMQMLLNGGEYGGYNYLNDSVVREFTRCQFCEEGSVEENRRGAGFDKPLLDGSPGPTCGCTDLETFGHQGFTGTVTWADPEERTVYVFLSNRVYPNADNKKLTTMDIRTRVQNAFYEAIEKGRPLAFGD